MEEIKVHCQYMEMVDPATLTPNSRNPNRHPKRQIELLAKIIKTQGWRQPVTVSNRSGFIVRGHGCGFVNDVLQKRKGIQNLFWRAPG